MNRVMVLTERAFLYVSGNSNNCLKFSSNLRSKPRSPVLVSDSVYALFDVDSPWRTRLKLFSCNLSNLTASQTWTRLEMPQTSIPMESREPSVDTDKLSYEIFSILESKFLFGYEDNQKLWFPKQIEAKSENQLLPEAENGAILDSVSSIKNWRGKICILSIDGGGMRGILSEKALVIWKMPSRRNPATQMPMLLITSKLPPELESEAFSLPCCSRRENTTGRYSQLTKPGNYWSRRVKESTDKVQVSGRLPMAQLFSGRLSKAEKPI